MASSRKEKREGCSSSRRAGTKGSGGKLAEGADTNTTGPARSGVRFIRTGPDCACAERQLLRKTPYAKTRRFFTGELGATCLPSLRGHVDAAESKRNTLRRHELRETSSHGGRRNSQGDAGSYPNSFACSWHFRGH